MLPRFMKRYFVSLADAYEKDAKWDQTHGNTRRAAGTMRLAAFISPTPERYLWLSEMLQQLGHLHQAKKAIVKSIKLSGNMETFDAHFISGVLSSKLGDVRGAVAEIKKARSIDPENPLGVYAMGSLHASRGEFAKANEMFSKDVPVLAGNGEFTHTRALLFPEKSQSLAEKLHRDLQNPDARNDHFKALWEQHIAEQKERERQELLNRVVAKNKT